MGWIKRHWLALFGAIPLLLPTLSKWTMWLIGRGGDADFIISRIADPGWIRSVLNFLLDPPGWANLPLILAGLLLIWLDVRRLQPEMTRSSTATARHEFSSPCGQPERLIASGFIEPVRKPSEARIQLPPSPRVVEAPIVEAPIAPSIPTPKIKAPEIPPREFVDAHVTPEFLVGLYEGQTTLGAEMRASKYIGKWISVSGPLLETVGGWPFLGERTPVVASLAFPLAPSIVMTFHSEWIDRLAVIAKNQRISVHGQIKEI